MADNIQKKKKSLLVPLLLLITLAACAAAGYFWYSSQNNVAQTVRQAPPPLPPVFLPLEPMTVSLITKQDGYDVSRVLYVGVTLRLPSEEEKTVLTDYLPEVRSRLLLLFSHQDVTLLSTEAGKQKLKESIIEVLKPPYHHGHQTMQVDDVLFSHFILR